MGGPGQLGSVRYDISLDTAKRRWYVDASWRIKPAQPPPLEKLRRQRVLGVDLNADHLACWPLDDSGNPIGQPYTISLKLSDLPARTRDGRLRSAVAELVRLATSSGCQSIAIENLDFADVRQIGRELSAQDAAANGSAASSPVSRPADLAL